MRMEKSTDDIFCGVESEDADSPCSPTPTSTLRGFFADTPVNSSGVSGSPRHRRGHPSPITTAEPVCASTTKKKKKSTFQATHCPECNKLLKTAGGLRTHKILHKITAANSRKPSFEEMYPEILGTMEEILVEISNEPALNEGKKKFVDGLLTSCEVPNWFHFVSNVAEPLVDLLLERTKVMPINQYEETLKKVNALLNDPDHFDELKQKISVVVPEANPSDDKTVGMVVFRIVHKLCAKLQVIVAKRMRNPFQPRSMLEMERLTTMNDREKTAFRSSMSCILRAFYEKGHQIQRSEWQAMCTCLRERFIFTAEGGVSSKEFLDICSWKQDSDVNIKICISDKAFKFFLCIEGIIRSMEFAPKEKIVLRTKTVMDYIFSDSANHEYMLNLWFWLTTGNLTESQSLTFLQELIGSIVNVSCNTQAEKLKRIWTAEKSTKEQKYALRTSLKRN